jgi:hypothetical protein
VVLFHSSFLLLSSPLLLSFAFPISIRISGSYLLFLSFRTFPVRVPLTFSSFFLSSILSRELYFFGMFTEPELWRYELQVNIKTNTPSWHTSHCAPSALLPT